LNHATPSDRWARIILGFFAVVTLVLAILVIHRLQSYGSSIGSSNNYAIAKLRVGVSQPPFSPFWYPYIKSNNFSIAVNNLGFEGLTAFKDNAVVADLATSWTNPNDNTWIFNLAQGVKFHDGATMTSQDVATSINNNLTNQLLSAYTSDIHSAVAISKSSVELTTTEPDALLPKQLTQIWIYDPNSNSPNSIEDGTGPYTLQAGSSVSNNLITLIAFSGYHGAKPSVGELDFYNYPTLNLQMTALKSHQLDMADLAGSTASSTLSAVKAAGYSTFTTKQDAIYALIPNLLDQYSPIQSLQIRQALYKSINPTTIAAANGDKPLSATQMVTSIAQGYNPAISRPAVDTSLAKSLISQAGYPYGLTLKLTYYSPGLGNIATALQQELSPVGITLKLNPQTSLSTYQSDVTNGDGDLFLEAIGSTLDDTSDVASHVAVETPEIDDSQVNMLYVEALASFSTITRVKLLQQMNQVIMNNLEVLPLYAVGGEDYAVKPGLMIQQNLDGSNYALDFPSILDKSGDN
jgi:peptide/nickel transport system substrate-binding protein